MLSTYHISKLNINIIKVLSCEFKMSHEPFPECFGFSAYLFVFFYFSHKMPFWHINKNKLELNKIFKYRQSFKKTFQLKFKGAG